MFTCPKCGHQMSVPATFCTQCGAPMNGEAKPPVSPVPPVIPVTPAPRPAPRLSKGPLITGMALAAAGLMFGAIGLLYTMMFMALDGIAAFAFGLVFGMISLPLSLVGLIMSSKNRNKGDRSVFSKLGKIFGLIGVIASGIMLLLAIIAIATYDGSSPLRDHSDYYYDFI